MSSFVLTDCSAWIGGLPLTSYSSELSVATEAEEKDVTVFGQTSKSLIAGLAKVDASLKGFWESAVDAQGVTNLGVVDQVCTFAATTTETDPAVFFRAGNFSYARGGDIGDVNPFNLSMMGNDGIGSVHGKLAKARGNVSATGVLGSVVNITAPTAGQYVYCAFHVFTAGTTITVQLQSDTAANFPSPTTQATIGPLTTTGGTWATRVAGALTGEDYWRLNVSAITGTFNVGAAIGVA